jgi:hypothetical protein
MAGTPGSQGATGPAGPVLDISTTGKITIPAATLALINSITDADTKAALLAILQ